MTLNTFLKVTATAVTLVLSPLVMANDDYPEKAVEFIVPWAPGGSSDLLMRIIGQHLQEELGQPVPIINMPGVSGTVGLREATRRANDGYTISQIHEGLLMAHHAGLTDINWDDFEPIAMMANTNQVVVINADTGWESMDDLLSEAREKPGELRIGVTLGGIPHLWAAMLEQAADVQFGYVGYEGSGERLRALAGGHILFAIDDYASTLPFVDNGDMRIIATGTSERLEELPDVPTLSELGYDIEFSITRGLVAPKGTPEHALVRLEEALANVAQKDTFIEQVNNVGADVRFMDREAYRDYLLRTDDTIQEHVHLLD
ncbi:tripartite tricarboxylate transporter substrate binding protein [Halomonas daqingensis]|uniref:Tripartite tricarboxylate transporter substrate binding protein n=1 Tax=Billgrantia desiderata TaxID=52021 RepID=A0ABS9B4X3_9GAMM|nr:tripartite tricarboxylate transporter substrate binding protein [Halomonas desiderata]MCE8013026.1 tripartite tricarboxylate transporter substrate binding protein [Halomonas desiderata]MCE8030169.1 tripartite tricarboxylate transporter substrate binding protein [Halomonas desiderata]MCE8042671.1 tripartite tricarboxylate transporter substrate binding protein [Halomonas desiderata]MCE8047246.1 tripartite tricarboxylate transporter substrate binding protein [Halomonas desiderata]OUE43941.1 hy